MQETAILEAIERYIRGEMLPEERVFFEQLRKTNPSVDQMVVEHTIFLNQMNQYGETKELKSRLQEIHAALTESGEIDEKRPAVVITRQPCSRASCTAMWPTPPAPAWMSTVCPG